VDPNQKVWFLSLNQLSCLIGVIFGNLVVFILQTFLSKEAMISYGWRIPFWISFLFILVASSFRQNLTETEAFEEAEEQTDNANDTTVEWPTLFALISMKIADPFWCLTAWLPDYLFQKGIQTANLAVVLVQLTTAIAIMGLARIADGIDWYKYMVASKIAAAFIGYPMLFLLLPYIRSTVSVFWALVPIVTFEFCFNALMDVYCMKLLPKVQTRATTMALAHNISGFVWGTLPFWASLIISNGADPIWVGFMLFTVAIISLCSVFVVRRFENKLTNASQSKTPPPLENSN
jgi:MHS family proline/betaine transporter-like MFS transporter